MPTANTVNRILLKHQDATPHEEALAGAALKPGELIKLNTSGEVVVHATAGGVSEKAFALEDALRGKDVDTAYASGDRVFYVIAQPGDVIYAKLSAGENVDIGDHLSSNGDGALREATGSDTRLAVALQAVNATDSVVDDQDDEWIKVRVL